MRESDVKRVLDGIEPKTGAQERMYANIQKKFAAQKENLAAKGKNTEMNDAPQKRHPIPLRRWGSLAACLAIVAAASLILPKLLGSTEKIDSAEGNPPPVMVGSPVEDVSGVQDFEKLGFIIDAPKEAENVGYYILDGRVAQIIFSLDGGEYTYRAAELDEDFSGVYGEVVRSVLLDAEYDAVLDYLSPDMWRVHWSSGGIRFYLTGVNGVDEGTITAVVKALLEDLGK